jgi:hypothetical protein
MEEDRSYVPLTNCTSAVLVTAEAPDLQIAKIPAELNVGAEYCLVVLSDEDHSQAFADFILSEEG